MDSISSNEKPAPNLTPSTIETPAPYIGMFNLEVNTWISNDYCSDWKFHEAIREILQNQMDGMCLKSKGGKKYIEINASTNEYEFDFNHLETNEKLGEIRYDKEKKLLTVWNLGTLETADLLLGGKKGETKNEEIIGRFGEGMKLAALAFARLQKIFIIITGGEEWRFDIKEDTKFKRKDQPQKCLFWWKNKIKNKDYKNYEGKIVVLIKNIEFDEWKNEIDNYLWLTQKNIGAITAYSNDNKTVLGQILLAEHFRNKIFVKDIFVTNTMKKEEQEKKIENSITHCHFGFNTDLTLDRDRNCVPDLNQRNQKTSQIIAYILNNRSVLYKQSIDIHPFLDNFPKEILYLLSKNYGVTYYLHNYINREGANLIWAEWKKNPNNNGKQPCYIDCEKNIKNFILNKKLNEDFYPYVTTISWQQWPNLRKSIEYTTIEQKFENLKKNSKEDCIPEKYVPALKEISDKMKLVSPNFDQKLIHFKKYTTPVDRDFSYLENGIIYFSSDLFTSEPDLNWKIKLLAKCFQIKGISAHKIIEVFKLLK